MSFCVDHRRFDGSRGAYVLIPGGTKHTFENRGDVRAGFIGFNTPGGFEERAQPIADWFAANSLGKARGR